MASVAGRVLSNHKHVVIALTAIFGVGRSTARAVCDVANVPPNLKVSELTDEQLESLREAVSQHTVEGDLRRQVMRAIKELIDKKCYRGRRHLMGLPARGQRSKTNARTAKKRNRRR